MKFSFPVRIYLVALVLRLIPILLTHSLGIGLNDMFQYDMLARSLASGNGYRWYAQTDLKQLAPYVNFDLASAKDYDPKYGLYTSFRAPLYPAFLAMVYFFSGTGSSRFLAARFVQAVLLGAPLAPLTYFVANHLSCSSFSIAAKEEREKKSEKIARVSAWVVAFYPMLLIYPIGLGTENLFFVLLLASCLLLLKSIEQPNKFNSILSGILLALTALTRSVILPFAGLAILSMIARRDLSRSNHFVNRKLLACIRENPMERCRVRSKGSRQDIFFMGIAFVLVIAPWVIRNSLLHHKLTGIETSMGYNLYLGYHPQGNGSFIFGPSLDLLTIMDDSERDKVGSQKAIGFIEARPDRILPLAINRLGFFFGLEKRVLMYFYSNNLVGNISKPILLVIAAILLLPFVIISISATLGLSLLRWNSQSAILLFLFAAYLLPHVFILAEDRFHLALIPFFGILAVQFWIGGFRKLSARWNGSLAGRLLVLLACCGVVLLLLNWGFELSRDADKIARLLGPDGNKTYFPY